MLAGLPVVAFVLPALAGYPVLPGDDLTQSYPLRVLAGSLLRHGHLPLLDPYIWSGAPLLGGWNAGAAYPLTFLFAVLPGVAAWTVNMTVTWWAAGLGTFAFLRGSRLSPAASFLGALSFAFAGAMTAQLSHIGLVEGVSWVPLALLAVRRLAESHSLRARLAWGAVLAAAIGLVILAGEPRAIDDAAVIIASYAAWRAWRLRRWPDGAAYLALVLAGVALGVALGAVQWMPGLAAVHTSQRAAHSAALFDSGSLARKWLLLLLVPDLLGGSGSFGQPAFFASYNLTEVTGYVGLMPVVAAFALLGRLRREKLPEWVIWHLVALAGILLALGGNTPLGRVLVNLPLFGDQRLQSRNLMIADLALAVLLAYWADIWLSEPRARRLRLPARQLAGAAPGIAAIGVAAAALAGGPGMLRWLGVSPSRAGLAGPLRPWLLPALVLGCLAIALLWWGPRLEPARRTRALACFVAADVTAFTLLAVVAVAPGPGHAAPPAAAPAAARALTAATHRAPAAVVPLARLTHGGRFAVYDPGLIQAGELSALGVPDGNVLSGTPSIEGYSAIVDASYASATGSHLATGDGQDVLAPRAIGDGTLDQLSTTVLVTPAAYLRTQAGAPASTGYRNLAPHQTATWYFGSLLPVASITIPAGGPPGTRGSGIRIGLLRASGATEWITTTPGPGGSLDAVLSHHRDAVAVLAAAGPGGASLRPPVVGTTGGARYWLDGQLQDALVPPRWRFAGLDGAFAVFRDSMAKPALALRALPGGSVAGARIRATGGPGFAPASAEVSSAHGVTVIRAVADIPGWTATWRPAASPAASTAASTAGSTAAEVLLVHRSGLVQAVNVPAGRGTITWAYSPPGARPGLVVSCAALAVLLAVLIAGAATTAAARRRRGHDERARPMPSPGGQLPEPSPAGTSAAGTSAAGAPGAGTPAAAVSPAGQ